MKKNRNKKSHYNNVDNVLDDGYETPKKWFETIADDPPDFEPVTEQVLVELKDEAKKCHDSETANYNIKNQRTNPNYQWMKTVMSKGTVSDKVAAHTVTIQDNPISNLDSIRSLVSIVRVGKKKECTSVIDALTELFLSDLLRPDEKLKPFDLRPLSLLNEITSGNAITRRKILSAWYFEDQLKEIYASYVTALNNVARDTIDSNKEKAISAMYKLLAGNPEQEKNLLAHIVNKLGDPSQKVASKAIYTLGQLLIKHSNMQGVVLNEVEKLLFRSNVSTKAQYYGLCFLSQFCLSEDAQDVARRLIEVYFSFFNACIKKGEVDSRMMSALLMGVNRAYPYAKLDVSKISHHIDTIYRVVHVANFNIGIHALNLLYQVSDSTNNVSDRFYSALYRKMADCRLISTTHQAMLLSLIYKALLKDTELYRVKVFVKRLLQLALFTQPAFACGILYLLSQLMNKKNGIGGLILKQSTVPDLDEDNEDEERYCDAPIEDTEVKPEADDEEDDIKPDVEELNATMVKTSSWYHCANSEKKHKKCTQYNPLSRNPLYAGGEFCAYTELLNLSNHFHPSVALFAGNLLEEKFVKYPGDPLKDFTLIRFLDRFVFKNPKKSNEVPAQGPHPTLGKRKFYRPRGTRSLPVNSLNYLNTDSKKIPVDELFVYSYLQKKYEEKKSRSEDDDGDDSDLDSVQSDEFEEMLDKMAGPIEDEDLDYMNDIGNSLKAKNEKRKIQSVDDNKEDGSVEDEEEEFREDDEDADEMSLGDDEDLDEMSIGDDEDLDDDLLDDVGDDEDEDIVFDEDSEDDRSIKKGKSKKKKKGDDIESVFASAEEFAALLEDEGSSKVAPGGSNAFANKDNANLKQIAWEDKRNHWIRGFNKAANKDKGKPFNKKRTNSGFRGNKAKKMKK